jgi:exosortase C (VPDSG-CTERM-specific)
LFVQPLVSLVSIARHDDLYSHIPLIPLVSVYLLFTRRPDVMLRSSVGGTGVMAAIGLAALAGGVTLQGQVSGNDALSLLVLSYVSFIAAGAFLFLGATWMAAAAFPMAFLVFMIPLPDSAAYWLERGSVLASAEIAALFFRITGVPLLRDGTLLGLPGITLQVAQECSGIRSSWVLLISSVLVSNLFLRSPWRRTALVAFVIPLALVRNAFRILVIGLLCVYIGPQMIDSVIHHHGGPVFFALSLVPLFLFMSWLWRQEHAHSLARRR